MVKQTLKDYLFEATNYLCPTLSEARLLEEKERIISFCEKHGLSEKFLSLVESDPTWHDLSQKETVQYFIEYPRFLTRSEESKLPDIEIIKCELGKVPVIKISVRKGSFH